jgi:hypothetical protein
MSTEIAAGLEQRLVASINAERAVEGLDPLKIEAHLNASAQSHSDWMAEAGDISHAGEGGSTPTDRIEEAGFPLVRSWQTAENVASITTSGELDEGELDRLHQGLMDSAGHKANILDPGVAYVGVGLSLGMMTVDGVDREAVFLTQNFADTEGEVLVQEEQGGRTVLQPYQDGEPVGEPQPAGDPEEEPQEEEDPRDVESASAGGCFVATAAYGSWRHPDVLDLRRFRDEVLVRHGAGRALIRAYRAVGPELARHVTPDGASGRAARAVIAPLARLARKRLRR